MSQKLTLSNLVTVPEAAKLLGMSIQGVHNCLKDKRLTRWPVTGRAVLVTQESITAMLAERQKA